MWVSVERDSDAADQPRFLHGAFAGDPRFPDDGEEDDSDSCSSASIGRNSDLSDEESGEAEIQSSFKGPLDSMDALEDVLPVRKGISKFYNGKSKSFTSLEDACAASDVKEIAKPEDPYSKKRKNLLVHSMLWDRNRHNVSGMPKKMSNCSQSSVALGMMAMSVSDESTSLSSSPSFSRPPLHPRGKRLPPCIEPSLPDSPPPLRSAPWRSFSLSDLLSLAAAATPNNEDKLR